MTWIPRPIFIIYLILIPTRVILEVFFMIYYIIPIVDGTLEFMDEIMCFEKFGFSPKRPTPHPTQKDICMYECYFGFLTNKEIFLMGVILMYISGFTGYCALTFCDKKCFF